MCEANNFQVIVSDSKSNLQQSFCPGGCWKQESLLWRIVVRGLRVYKKARRSRSQFEHMAQQGREKHSLAEGSPMVKTKSRILFIL